jgi:exonuclease III
MKHSSILLRFLLVLTVLAVSCTPEKEDTPPPEEPAAGAADTSSSITIMTFNTEFMWDGVEPEQGNVEFEWKGNQELAEAKMAKIAEIIRRANPDILNLVEVENLDALETLNRKFLSGMGYTAYLVEGRDSYTGQDVGLLTRIPPEGSEIQPDFRKGSSGGVDKVVSKNYKARFTIGATKLALIGLHFLAQPDREDRRFDRQAQADAIRQMAVEQQAAGYLPVVLGDFNDYDGEANSQDVQKDVPITFVVSAIKSMDPENLDDDLVNVSSFIPQKERYTAFWDRNNNGRVDPDREFTSIDHILISNKLAGKVERAWIPHDHDPLQVSDHFPVVVKLRLGPGEANGGGTGGGGVVDTSDDVKASPAKLSISGLLPDPDGSDDQNEEARIMNRDDKPVDMRGWKLRDKAGRTWALDELGIISAGEEKSIRRKGQSMDLNNSGDTVELLDPSGAVVDSLTYGAVRMGIWIKPVAT